MPKKCTQAKSCMCSKPTDNYIMNQQTETNEGENMKLARGVVKLRVPIVILTLLLLIPSRQYGHGQGSEYFDG